jgi:hypothetical protein
VDPLEEEYLSYSPYNYVLNHPTGLIDSFGMAPGDPPEVEQLLEEKKEKNPYLSGNPVSVIQQTMRDVLDGMRYTATQVANGTKEVTKTSVKFTSKAADVVSDAAMGVAVGDIVAAPFTESTSLSVTAVALEIVMVADVVSTVAKTVDAFAFDGSGDEALRQFGKTMFSAGTDALMKSMAGRLITRTGTSVIGPLFRSARTGRFVTNKYGFTVTAVADATNVATSKIIDKVVDR